MFLNDMDFGFEETVCAPSKLNRKAIAPVVAAAAITAAGAAASAAASSGDGGGTSTPKIRKSTTSGETQSDLNILYDDNAQQAINDFSDQVGTWMEQDRDFFTNTFQPFNEQLINTNAQMLPAIEKVAGSAMEAITRDMVSNESLKNSLRGAMEAGQTSLGSTLSKFEAELDNLPTEEERMSQAFSQVEGQFGKVGQQLERKMAEQGRAVSQASQRELAIEKAKAKSGVAGQAKEAARAERLNKLGTGLGTISDLQTAQSGMLTQASQIDLATRQQGLGATGTQVSGVTAPTTDLAELTGGVLTAEAGKTIGTDVSTGSIQHVQKGIKSAPELTEDFQLTPEEQKKRATKPKGRVTTRTTTPRVNGPGVGGADAGGGGSADTGGMGTGMGSGGSGPGPGAGPGVRG